MKNEPKASSEVSARIRRAGTRLRAQAAEGIPVGREELQRAVRELHDRLSALEMQNAALRGKENLLHSVMQTTDVMLAFLDLTFDFVWVNNSYAATCRMRPEELVGRNHFALYPHPENEAIFRKVRDRGEGVFYKDKPFLFPDQPERGVTYWDRPWTRAAW